MAGKKSSDRKSKRVRSVDGHHAIQQQRKREADQRKAEKSYRTTMPPLEEMEALIASLSGFKRARIVVEDGHWTELHVVTDPERKLHRNEIRHLVRVAVSARFGWLLKDEPRIFHIAL